MYSNYQNYGQRTALLLRRRSQSPSLVARNYCSEHNLVLLATMAFENARACVTVCVCVCVCVWAPDAFTSSHLQNYFYLNWFLFLFFVFISFFSVALKLFVWKFACIYVFVFFLYLRSRGSNIRYFKVLSNSIERLRAAPPSTIDKQPATSSLIKFYLPPIRPKIK